ncbi:hypothetical protein BGZ57DRAFT_266339 [Hyaloscypha finlandica]|nr:hypothetical protein BGZ57DRAFT_266339 [Hyaloscypha finlandica]
MFIQLSYDLIYSPRARGSKTNVLLSGLRPFHPHAQPDAVEIPARRPSCTLVHERRYTPCAETTAERLVNLNIVLIDVLLAVADDAPIHLALAFDSSPFESSTSHHSLGEPGTEIAGRFALGPVGWILGNRRNRRAIRVKHIGTLPLNPYCALRLLKKHGSEWEISARSLPLGARRFPLDSKHLSISLSKVSCFADRQNDRSYHSFFEGSEHAGNDLSRQATPRTLSAPHTPLVTMSSDVAEPKPGRPNLPRVMSSSKSEGNVKALCEHRTIFPWRF